ncbi:hypothetical protein B0I37DRAFT_365628 [Chaetomium sp. MPI-CAGE-AT-0009]|nr:hypothetical protein B0I37DRAFT_365628 [Chaetomium sp. MPI-CAGE-AT-0009]
MLFFIYFFYYSSSLPNHDFIKTPSTNIISTSSPYCLLGVLSSTANKYSSLSALVEVRNKMRLVSRAVRSLVASLACLGVVVEATGGGVLEVDLIFPRNETYAPTDSFPIVFAFQNPELAWYLNTDISYTIRNWSYFLGDNVMSGHDLRWTNWSTHDPYFVANFFDEPFAVEGQWRLTWADPDDPRIIANFSRWSVDFTISNGGQPVDLVAATADDEKCPVELGAAIRVTGETKAVGEFGVWSGGDTCAVLDISSPTPTPNPCAVKIDSATAASISASWTARVCDSLGVFLGPDKCPPPPESASQQLAVAGLASLAVAFGAFGFLLL